MSPQRIRNIVLPLCAVLLAASCSTTRRLGSDEVLYTGVKKILIEPDSGVVLTPAAESAVKEPLSVAPNNPLYSPYLRTPLPVGLWAYNHLYTPKEKGFKYWFYKRLAKQPVLISKVQPQLRTKVAEQVLENYGYFGSRAADSLLYRKRGRKAKVRYTLGIAPAWRYSSIAYPQVGEGLKQLIDSLQATSLLRVGAQYNLDSLTLERKRISQLLRNRGYYYFRPEYMEYLADTTAGRRQVALRLNLRPNVPQAALMPYRVGDVTVRLTNIKPGPADTLRLPDATVIARRPLKIRPRVLSRALTLRPGQLFTVDAQNRTQTDLNKLGIFRSVNLSVTPLDSLRGSDTLDVEIDARFDYPLEAALETDVTSKSNSFIGPGVTFRVSNNNLFRGGEVLSVKLNGSYEWQTGNKNSGGRSSRLNSYELGLNANLDIPRLLLPRSMTRQQKYPGSTSFQLGVDLMNRPSFFRLIAFSGSAGYNFQTSPYSRHSLTVFKLTYNKLLHTTEAFDKTMDENPAIAMSFRNQFVPSINYTYTFERTYGAVKRESFLPPKAPKRPVADHSEEKRRELKQAFSGEDYLLVDGYNIIFAWDELKKLAAEHLDAARKKLCDLLCNYQGYRKCRVILVFDAYKVKGGLGSVEKYHNITIVYTKEAETADAYIERATYEIGRQHRVRVATSDGPEQIIILGHGALRLSASAFHEELMEVQKQIGDTVWQNNRKNANSGAVRAAMEKAKEGGGC